MSKHENNIIRKTLYPIDKNTRVLEVGCGYGEKLKLLQDIGFNDITGVEINETLVKQTREKGFNVLSVDEFTNSNNDEYDLIVLSHIIEHFQYVDLKEFLENYLEFLKEDGYLLIITPTLNDSFFDDYDHVKPYSHIGLSMVFGNKASQVQFYSKYILELLDLRYTRLAYQLKFYRAIALRTPLSIIPKIINKLSHLVYRLSFRLIGRPVSWVGLFRKKTKP